MKLSRKQKICRNLLCVALLLFIWWLMTGMQPVTPSQALRWEAQRWGLTENPRILYRTKGEKWYQSNIVFTVNGQLGTGELSWGIWNSDAKLGQIRMPQEVTILRQTGMTFSKNRSQWPLYVVACIPEAADVEMELHMAGRMRNTLPKLDADWEGTYCVTARPNEQGVYPLLLEQTDRDSSVERRMFDDLVMAMDGYELSERTYEIRLTFRDEKGAPVKTYTKTYENKGWNDLKEEKS